jgi:DNA invertase Pin-like site-specific DNA recombinase
MFALKEGLRLTGAHALQTTVIVTLFGLFAEIERTLLSLRTKEALAAVKVAGKPLERFAIACTRHLRHSKQYETLLSRPS